VTFVHPAITNLSRTCTSGNRHVL